MERLTRYKTASIVFAILTLAGIAAWVYQLIGGLGVTGMSNGTSWGLYITCFMFFVGLSAGGLIVASSASVFRIAAYKKVALPAIILSTVCICLAGIFILIDLGGIQRAWLLIVSPNVASPLIWDVFVITCYLIINILYLYFMKSKKANARKVEIISRFALPVAVLVHSVTAWIFGLQIAREGWYSAIMAPLFVVSAMTSGLALLLLVLAGMSKLERFKTEKTLIASLAGLLVTCVAIDGFLIGSEVLTMAYPGAGAAETLALMTTGPMAPFFWFEIIVGIIVPFCILVFAKNRQSTSLVVVASVCVVVGVFFKRVWLLLTSFIVPNVYGAPGISSGSSAATHATGVDIWSLVGVYAPTWVEILIAVGIVSLGILAFLIMIEKLVVDDPGSKKAGSITEAEAVAKAV